MDKRKFNKGHIKGVPSGKKGKVYSDKDYEFRILVNTKDKIKLTRFAFQRKMINEINFNKRMEVCKNEQKTAKK